MGIVEVCNARDALIVTGTVNTKCNVLICRRIYVRISGVVEGRMTREWIVRMRENQLYLGSKSKLNV